MLLLCLVLLPFAGSLVAATLPSDARTGTAWLSGLVMSAGLLILAALHGLVARGQVLRSTLPWLPSLDLNLDFRLDGFSWLFVTLVLGIGVLVIGVVHVEGARLEAHRLRAAVFRRDAEAEIVVRTGFEA